MTDVDPTDVRNEYRYEKLTWPEINEAIAQKKVIVLPAVYPRATIAMGRGRSSRRDLPAPSPILNDQPPSSSAGGSGSRRRS